MIETQLDQTMRLSDDNRRVFDDVDDVLGRAITAGDPIIALEYGRELLATTQVQGLALAKLLYKLQKSWSLFEASGTGDSLEALATIHMGRSAQTVTKYIRLWENVFENESIPEDIRQKLMGRPIQDLLLITALAREGADEKKLAAIAAAPDHSAVRAIVRGERGPRNSSQSAVHIVIEMRYGVPNPPGTLTVDRTVIGQLDVNSTNAKTKAAIARIIRAAGITERFE